MVLRSPAHARAYLTDGSNETEAQRLGTMIHTAVLEPDLFVKKYRQGPDAARNTKAWKDADRAAVDELFFGELIKPAEWEICRSIQKSVSRHPLAKAWLSGGFAEQSVFWDDPDTELSCKARPDYVRQSGSDAVVLFDLKTTTDCRPPAFVKAVAEYGYHIQAAYYLDGWNAIGPTKAESFAFVAVEKAPPFSVWMHALGPQLIAEGRAAYKRALRIFKECQEVDEWPGYEGSDTVNTITELPSWATRWAE
jgi:hypothetical protein